MCLINKFLLRHKSVVISYLKDILQEKYLFLKLHTLKCSKQVTGSGEQPISIPLDSWVSDISDE